MIAKFTGLPGCRWLVGGRKSQSRFEWMLAGGIVLMALRGGSALADVVSAAGLEFKDVKITRVEKDPTKLEGNDADIYYTSANGKEAHRTITDKLRITVNDEPALNAGEEAFMAGKFADAGDNYSKALRATNKPWLKLYVVPRLLKAAQKSNRFDLAVGAWLALVDQDPKLAAGNKPALPSDPKSVYVTNAAAQVEALGNSTKDSSKATMLLTYALELYQAAGNEKKVTDLANSLGRTASASSNAPPEAVGALAASKLSLASIDVDKKDFKSAMTKLADVKDAVSDPGQQADWLWVNAEVQEGVAGDTKDPKVLQSVVLDYMRVVAHFPGSKHTPDALLHCGAIYEKLGDTAGALNLYQQVVRDYSEQPAGLVAKKNVQRLKPTPQAAG